MPATIDIDALINQLRASGRTELVHYAGAAHRDRTAWHLCAAYLADPAASEVQLKSRALQAAFGWDVAPETIAAVHAAADKAKARQLARTVRS